MSQVDAPIRKSYLLTVGQVAPVGREFAVKCTVAGDILVHISGDPAGQNHNMGVLVGYSVFPYSVDQIISMTATAVCTNMGVLGG